MRTFDYPGFPDPLRVRIVLAEKGLAQNIEFTTVDLPAAEHKQPPFLKINPEGTVPVLQLNDGALHINQSARPSPSTWTTWTAIQR